jgi:hypothetical protein
MKFSCLKVVSRFKMYVLMKVRTVFKVEGDTEGRGVNELLEGKDLSFNDGK